MQDIENKSTPSTEKKFRISPLTIVCYAIAAFIVIYMCYIAGSTVNQINEYYAQFEMSAKATDYIMYIGQALASPAASAFTFFMLGYILDAVKRCDPKSYKSDAEIEDEKMAKKEARDAKAFAKGEKAAAKAASEKSDEDKVAADFANDLDKELKSSSVAAKKKPQRRPAAAKNGEKTSGGSRKQPQKKNGGSSTNRSGNRKPGTSGKAAGKPADKPAKKATDKPANKPADKPADKKENDDFKVEISE